jgi:hypothetical protein
LWSRTDTAKQDVSEFGSRVQHYLVPPLTWNGRNIVATYMYFSQGPALASVNDVDERCPRIAFPLPEKPLQKDDRLSDQHLVASIDPGIGLFGNERYTMELPFLPRLNEYYGRHVWFKYDEARAEPDTLGIICDGNKHDLSINAVPVVELVTEIFKLAGITATTQKPGLLMSQ